MSYQYEYLDPSCYVETEQFQTQRYEVEQHLNNIENIQYDQDLCGGQLEREQDTNVETIEEQNVEIESNKLKYQNADILIQTEIKEIICKKETEKTTLVILNEQKDDILKQIQSLQQLRSKIDEENEFLNINNEIEKEEFLKLQKRVTYNGEIVERLRQFIETIENGFRQLKLRSRQHTLNIMEQKEKSCNSENIHRKKISQLKNDIDKRKALRKADPDPLKDENLILKAKIVERQTHLKELQKCRQVEDMKRNYINQLINKKCELKNDLECKQKCLRELKDIRDKKEMEINERMKQIDISRQQRSQRLNDAVQTKENINAEIHRIIQEQKSQTNIILQKEEYNLQLAEEISKLAEITEIKKKYFDEQNQQYKRELESAQEYLKSIETELTELKKQNDELSCGLELAKQEYIAKMEEKSDKLLSKLECEEKLHSDEVLLTNFKILEEQIIIKKKSPEELSAKIDGLCADQSLEELNKKKAYLISSTEYLSEKLENVKKESEKMKLMIKDFQDKIDCSKQFNKENEEKHELLQKEVKEEMEVEEEAQRNVTPSSILKSPLSHKKGPISPKKVKFEGLSSFESSSNSEPLTCSGSTQQSIVGKTFDDILQEIHAESFKKPLKAPKKRKLDLE